MGLVKSYINYVTLLLYVPIRLKSDGNRQTVKRKDGLRKAK